MGPAIATGDVLDFGSLHQKPIICVIPICVQLFVVAGFVFGITAHNVVAVWTGSTLSVVVKRIFFRKTIREKLLILEDEEHALAYQACSRIMIIPLFVDIPSWKISLACVHHAAWFSVLVASVDDSFRSVARFLPREGMVVYSAGFFVTVSPGSIEIASSHCSEQGKRTA